MLNTNELPINASSERRKQENILKEPKNFHKRKKNRTPSFIPKTISEIRKYYKTKGESKFRLDFIKSPDLKKQIKPNYLSNQKEKKNIPSLIINRLSTEKKCPQNITKYKDFQAIYKESHSLLTSKRRLPISNMSSIHNDQTSLDSFILDKDIDEHDYHSIEIKNFIKRDSKLKGKHDMLSPPIKSLNTTTQINLTGRLFNEGYYSEEIENSKGKSKIYQSVKDLIKKQQEHLQNEYKKLKDGSNSKRLLEAKHPYSNTLTNLLIEDKLNHS